MNEQRSIASAAVAAGLVTLAGGDCAPGETPCDTHAEAFFDLSPNWRLNESLGLQIDGLVGGMQFELASGTSLGSVMSIINSVAPATGVAAQQIGDAMRLRLYSSDGGADAFVSVKQIGGSEPHVFALSDGGRATWVLIAHGSDGLIGDANCDNVVGVADLVSVIDHWGVCSPAPRACVGDLDLNGLVNVNDLLLTITHWGATH